MGMKHFLFFKKMIPKWLTQKTEFSILPILNIFIKILGIGP
jgi:hypothetical protein